MNPGKVLPSAEEIRDRLARRLESVPDRFRRGCDRTCGFLDTILDSIHSALGIDIKFYLESDSNGRAKLAPKLPACDSNLSAYADPDVRLRRRAHLHSKQACFS
jgi:hypothetical protein